MVTLLEQMMVEPLIPLWAFISMQASGVNVRNETRCSVRGLCRELEVKVTFSPNMMLDPLNFRMYGILLIMQLAGTFTPFIRNLNLYK